MTQFGPAGYTVRVTEYTNSTVLQFR